MTIQQQVCTLGQAKRLKELGVTDETNQFYFINGHIAWGLDLVSQIAAGNEFYPAFTVAELGVMLPENINCFKSNGKFEVSAHKWQYPVKQIQEGFNFFVVKGDTEAECKSAMLITLLKQNLITADEVNARLLTTP
jgi:hypothetical protein